MKDAKGHGSNPRGGAAHAAKINQVGKQPLTLYHGTNADFSKFQLGHHSSSVWLADSETATDYARHPVLGQSTVPRLYTVQISGKAKMATPKQQTAVENSTPRLSGERHWEHQKRIVDKLKAAGFDGVRYKTMATVFDPKHLKIVKKGLV